MSDRYASFARSAPGHTLVKQLGLPVPPRLRRGPAIDGPVVVAGEGRFADTVKGWYAGDTEEADAKIGGLILDASTLRTVDDLRALYDIVQPIARGFRPGGRVIVIGPTPAEAADAQPWNAQPASALPGDAQPGEEAPGITGADSAGIRGAEAAAVAQALEGFTRSVAKEFGRGITAQLIRAAADAHADGLRTTLDFLLSGRSAYVSGQVVTVGPNIGPAGDATLDGKVALVTGAARGIGAEIAKILAGKGAQVVCLDVPAAGDSLAAVANEVRGWAYQVDLSGEDAAARVTEHLKERYGHVDVVVHNAGITRDKTLANMKPDQWDQVLGVNLGAPIRVTEAFLAAGLIPAGGRVIGVSSVVGLAGNRGQTNYATSKAGVAGWIRALAPRIAGRGITANAVAPGFIETAMTAHLPLVVREGGRRMNSLAQGGLPIDVAETIGWLAEPGSAGVTGNVVRVCGQQLLGA
ncbi:3-oxoacyl-ACP reductase [Hamadaea tsunoensis]|uniref:3-oxoacyl-ACP reductase n=1 Tax=Hamadaea tsunoensis TaxID=53368 RepID=UPI0003F8B14B|nr:3-oxoacyl-ACP reductase [Hamadaea tsunoensis]